MQESAPSIATRAKRLVSWKPLAKGEPAPHLSLTADEGTWIRLIDFTGQINAIFLFFRRLDDDATDAWLRDFQAHLTHFEEMDTAVFGVTTARTDRLREYRASLGLEFYLLYDPLALESRAFHATSRVAPLIRDSVVVVGKDGKVARADHDRVGARELLQLVAQLEGKSLTLDGASAESASDFQAVRNPGQAADRVKNINSDTAVDMLVQADSPYLLLDVRTLSEFEADHAKGAVHIPVDELPHRYQELGQTTRILCICQAGGRSTAAAEFLTSIGCSEIFNITGGMSEWNGPRLTGGKAD